MTHTQESYQLKCKGTDFNKPIEICEVCKSATQLDIEILGILRRVTTACSCRVLEREKKEQRDAFMDLQRRLDRFKRYSLMDSRFSESTFENWRFREDNKKIYKLGKQYCNNWQSMKDKNRGILFHGIAGNGKTYLSFAIANKLHEQGVSVLATSVSNILKIIMDSYNQRGEVGEAEILGLLRDTDLLILDDIGVENKTHWSYEKLYSILDARYRAKKPLIITTNLSLTGLQENLSVIEQKTNTRDESHRIYNRLMEMCSVIKVAGESWRVQIGEENTKKMLEELFSASKE